MSAAQLLALLLIVTSAGCGYHLNGGQLALPEDVHSISVGTLTNRSREFGLEKSLAFAFEREIHERAQFRMAQDPGDGDAILSGAIRNVVIRPVSFDANDQAIQYEVTLSLDLVLTRQHDGRVLWRVHDLREIDEYSASGGVTVTSSSQFQQGTLDAADLQNPQFASKDPNVISIQLAETERRRAIARILSQTVRDVYNQMVENF